MTKFLFITKWILYFLLGLLLLTILALLIYRIYLKSSTKIETPNGISALEEISLGDVNQWIFIRGEDQKNPVLLFLHGGPGEPAMGMSSSRTLESELIKHFTVVHWDQRGSGKSYNPNVPKYTMTYDQMVEDCSELIDYLCNRFKVKKVFLVAHSAGTPIGIKTAYKYPNKIYAYVGVSQIVNDYEQQLLSYNFIEEEAKIYGNSKDLNVIKAIGPPPYEDYKKIFQKAEYIVRYGGFIYTKLYKHMSYVMLSYLTTPEYSITDAIKIITHKGMYFTMDARWEEIKKVNFSEEIQSINIPVYFFIGKYDMITPTVQIQDYYNQLNAPKGKKLILFNNAAHLPMIEEKEKYQDLLVNMVLEECHEK